MLVSACAFALVAQARNAFFSSAITACTSGAVQRVRFHRSCDRGFPRGGGPATFVAFDAPYESFCGRFDAGRERTRPASAAALRR
jgi:hypothetical protein